MLEKKVEFVNDSGHKTQGVIRDKVRSLFVTQPPNGYEGTDQYVIEDEQGTVHVVYPYNVKRIIK